MELIFTIAKCLLVGVIWAALLIPVFFRQGNALKYIISVLCIAALCFFLPGYRSLITTMTLIALIALVLSFIASMAVLEKDSKARSKVISFSCVVAGFSYLIYVLFVSGLPLAW